MTIRRSPGRDRYVVIEQDTVRDGRLSFKARGLLAYILSLPDDWRIERDDLASRGPDGAHAIRSALVELVDAGYLVRTRRRAEDGTFYTDSVVHERPFEPLVGFPPADNPPADNPPAIETPKTKDLNPKLVSTDVATFDEFWAAYPRNPGNGKPGGGGTRKQAQAQWGRLSQDDRRRALEACPAHARLLAASDTPPKHAHRFLQLREFDDVLDAAAVQDRSAVIGRAERGCPWCGQPWDAHDEATCATSRASRVVA